MCWEAATRNLALGLLFEASVLLGACSHSVRTPAKKEKRAHARSTQNMSCRSPLCRVFGINTTLCLYKPEKRQSLSLSRPLIKRRDFSPLSLLATAQWRAGMGRPPVCSQEKQVLRLRKSHPTQIGQGLKAALHGQVAAKSAAWIRDLWLCPRVAAKPPNPCSFFACPL